MTSRVADRLPVLAALVLVALWVYRRIQRRKENQRLEERSNGVPGDIGLPFLGETVSFARYGPKVFCANQFKKYSSNAFRSRVLGADIIYIWTNDPDVTDYIYHSKDLFSTSIFANFQELMQGFLLLKDGVEHARQKGLVVTALSDKRVQGNFEVVRAHFVEAVNSWNGSTLKFTITIKRTLIALMNKLIISDLTPDESETLASGILKFGRGFFDVPINVPFTDYGQALQARRDCMKILRKVCENRRADPDKHAHKTDLFQGLVTYVDPDTQQPFDAATVGENAFVIFFGAIDTTASLMTSLVLKLNEEPEWRMRLVKEMNDKGGMPQTFDDLAKYTLLHAFICEVMRVAPPFSVNQRRALRDVKLPNTEIVIPEGFLVGVSYSTSFAKNHKAFPQPETFNPLRFMPGGSSFVHADFKHELYPFGKGAHICPGRTLSLTETKVLILLLLERSGPMSSLFPAIKEWPMQFDELPALEPRNDVLVSFPLV